MFDNELDTIPAIGKSFGLILTDRFHLESSYTLKKVLLVSSGNGYGEYEDVNLKNTFLEPSLSLNANTWKLARSEARKVVSVPSFVAVEPVSTACS